MRATQLNAHWQPEFQLTNLQTMYGTATSDQRRQLDLEYQDWARRCLHWQGRGPHPAGGGRGRNRHCTARTSEELELDACSLNLNLSYY
jgi:hypothetical protein